MPLSHTDETLEALRLHYVAQKKNGRAYHEARANYLEACAQNLRDERDLLAARVKAGSTVREKDLAQALEASQEEFSKAKDERDEAEEVQAKAETERDEVTAELKALHEALGLSSMDWERAKAARHLPTGQALIF